MKSNEERIEQFRDLLIDKLNGVIDDSLYELDAYDVITSQFIEKNIDTLVQDYHDILESYI